MDFQTAAALSASSLLLSIINICDENGGNDKISVKTSNPICEDLILGMCGACGGTIEDYRKEFSIMDEMAGKELSNSGSQALWDEVLELREKEKKFDALFLRVHELEEREIAVKRLENSIDNGNNKSELLLRAQLKEFEESLLQKEAELLDRERQLNEDDLAVQSLRDELLEEKQRVRDTSSDAKLASTNEIREWKLKSSMVASQLQRQQEEHQEEKDELLHELDVVRSDNENLLKANHEMKQSLKAVSSMGNSKQNKMDGPITSNPTKKTSISNVSTTNKVQTSPVMSHPSSFEEFNKTSVVKSHPSSTTSQGPKVISKSSKPTSAMPNNNHNGVGRTNTTPTTPATMPGNTFNTPASTNQAARAVGSYSSLTQQATGTASKPTPLKESTNSPNSSKMTARERRASEALKKHADRLKAVRKNR